MSIEKGETSEVDGSAPLDLRVKKEVKPERTTPIPDNVPLNLSKPVSTPAPTPGHPSPKVLKTELEAQKVQTMPGGPAVRAPAPPPLVKHTAVAGNGSKSMPVRPPLTTAGGPIHHQMALVSPPNVMVPGAVSSGKKQAQSIAPHPYTVPPHAIALETVVGSPKIPVGTESNHTLVTFGTSSPIMYGSPSKPVQTPHGTSSTVSPSRPMMAIPAAVPVPEQHHVNAPSPRSKKKTSPVPMENPVHTVAATSESSKAKVSPSSKVRQPKQEKQASLAPHVLQSGIQPGIQPGIPTSMDRQVSQVATRRLLPSIENYTGSSQKHPSGHSPPSVPFPQDLPNHPPRPRLPHRKKSPSSPPPTSQGHELTTSASRLRAGLPQQVSPRGVPLQHIQHCMPVGTLPHAVHAPPVDALLRLRHPVTAVSQTEGVSLYPPRATRPPGTHIGPHGAPPVLSQAPHQPTPPRPSPPRPSPPRPSPPRLSPPRPTAAPHTPQVSNHSPSSSAASTSSSSQPHPVAPPFREMHHAKRMRHPGAAGQGYIPPPPPSSEYYPMRPRVPQPSSTTGPSRPPGVPPLVQTPGPMQAPGQRFPASSAPFAVNPFVSLSIAIDCQRATEQDSDGDTALHIAIVQDKPDMGLVRRLIELVRLAGKTVDIFNFMQQTPLHLACIMKDADVIRLLVEAGSNPNEADRNGQTAAHHTCKSGTPSCLGAILRYSQMEVNLNIRNYEGYTPLHLAAMVGNPTLVTMLLEKGADLNSKDSKNGWTPLFHAVTNQDTKLVHKMLSSGAEVNVQSYSGNTVLHVATGRGFTDIVKILVHYGADMSLKNTQWDTPATITTDKNMSSLLRGLGAGSPQPNDSSSPSTPAPTLPMPLNDAYLIHRPSSASTSAAGSTPSKPPAIVTTMTTERLKGSANEVYEVTRHVTHQDAKSPDGGQRAIHKQTQERLRHSIQYRNERKSESHQRKPTDNIPPGQQAGNEKLLLVQVPARREEKEERTGGVQINVNEQYVEATSTPDVVPKIEITSPEPASKPVAPFKNDLNQKLMSKPSEQNTKFVMACDPSESITHQLVINVNGHLRTVPLKADNARMLDRKTPSIGIPIAPKGKTQPRRIAQKEPTTTETRPKGTTVEAALIKSTLIAEGSKRSSGAEISSPSPAKAKSGTPESENELRARMLSLQYKNSDAILSNRYERKLGSVGSEQEHEVANTILTIGSRLQQQELERQQKNLQNCDVDSTVKTEPVSPTPVLSSTTIDKASAQPHQTGRRLSPPVLEREGDRPLPKPLEDDKGDDGELNLVIDETLKSKSRKRTRTPTKSIPNLLPAKSSATVTTTSSSSTSDYVATSSDSVKLGKVKVMTGDPKKIWTKKALAMMGGPEPKRKRRKSEKSSKEN